MMDCMRYARTDEQVGEETAQTFRLSSFAAPPDVVQLALNWPIDGKQPAPAFCQVAFQEERGASVRGGQKLIGWSRMVRDGPAKGNDGCCGRKAHFPESAMTTLLQCTRQNTISRYTGTYNAGHNPTGRVASHHVVAPTTRCRAEANATHTASVLHERGALKTVTTQ